MDLFGFGNGLDASSGHQAGDARECERCDRGFGNRGDLSRTEGRDVAEVSVGADRFESVLNMMAGGAGRETEAERTWRYRHGDGRGRGKVGDEIPDEDRGRV